MYNKKNLPFDTSRPCAVCGAIGHSFDNCPALQDAGEIKKAYIRLRIAVNKIQRNNTSGTNSVTTDAFQTTISEQLSSIATRLDHIKHGTDADSLSNDSLESLDLNALSQDQKRYITKLMSSSDFPHGRR